MPQIYDMGPTALFPLREQKIKCACFTIFTRALHTASQNPPPLPRPAIFFLMFLILNSDFV